MKTLLFAVTAVFFLNSCATSPLGRKQFSFMPDTQMEAMGVEAFKSMQTETPVERDPAVNRYVRCIAEPIVRQIGGQWELVVFKDDEPNAFALPGRKIGVHTGLLKVAQNQHQLATVIGHEVAHVLSKHGNERVSQKFAVQMGLELVSAAAQPSSQMGQALMGALGLGAQFGVLMPFSRVHESEADMYGLDLMAKAGFDPRESVKLWQNMSRAGGGAPPEFFSTHPSHATRIKDLQERLTLVIPYYENAQRNGNKPNCR